MYRSSSKSNCAIWNKQFIIAIDLNVPLQSSALKLLAEHPDT